MKIKQKLLNQDMLFLLGVCAVPVDFWTIYTLMDQIPPWVRSNTTWDFIGLLAYPLAFAFLEILSIFLPIVVFRLVIPAKWLKDNISAFGFLYIAEFSAFVLLLQFVDSLFWQKKLLLLSFTGGLVLIFILVSFVPLVKKVCEFLAERLAILGLFFLIFNLMGIVIVIIRNIF